MSTLYLMRHGQTLFNLLRRKQGWCDSPLTELGQEQARAAGEWARANGVVFDHGYTSTSERACDTFELAFPGVEYTREKGLRERYFGTFEGLTEDTNPPTPYGDFYKPFGGETDEECRDRLVGAITEIMNRPDHERVLCVSHGGALAVVLRSLGYSWGKEGKRLGNCCIATLEFDPATQTFKVLDLHNPNAE